MNALLQFIKESELRRLQLPSLVCAVLTPRLAIADQGGSAGRSVCLAIQQQALVLRGVSTLLLQQWILLAADIAALLRRLLLQPVEKRSKKAPVAEGTRGLPADASRRKRVRTSAAPPSFEALSPDAAEDLLGADEFWTVRRLPPALSAAKAEGSLGEGSQTSRRESLRLSVQPNLETAEGAEDSRGLALRLSLLGDVFRREVPQPEGARRWSGLSSSEAHRELSLFDSRGSAARRRSGDDLLLHSAFEEAFLRTPRGTSKSVLPLLSGERTLGSAEGLQAERPRALLSLRNWLGKTHPLSPLNSSRPSSAATDGLEEDAFFAREEEAFWNPTLLLPSALHEDAAKEPSSAQPAAALQGPSSPRAKNAAALQRAVKRTRADAALRVDSPASAPATPFENALPEGPAAAGVRGGTAAVKLLVAGSSAAEVVPTLPRFLSFAAKLCGVPSVLSDACAPPQLYRHPVASFAEAVQRALVKAFFATQLADRVSSHEGQEAATDFRKGGAAGDSEKEGRRTLANERLKSAASAAAEAFADRTWESATPPERPSAPEEPFSFFGEAELQLHHQPYRHSSTEGSGWQPSASTSFNSEFAQVVRGLFGKEDIEGSSGGAADTLRRVPPCRVSPVSARERPSFSRSRRGFGLLCFSVPLHRQTLLPCFS